MNELAGIIAVLLLVFLFYSEGDDKNVFELAHGRTVEKLMECSQ